MAQVDLLREDEYLPIGGWSFSVNTEGKAPEELFANNQALKDLISYRNENYNSIEIYLSDFGWDTVNPESPLYVAPTDKQTSEEIQAMYILRSFLILQGMDVDKASYDLLNDSDLQGHGIIAKDGTKKLSFKLLEYFKAKMNGMYLTDVISSGENDIYCYKFEDASGKVTYAFWSPNGASITLRDLPESVTMSCYNSTTKAYESLDQATNSSILSKRIDGSVMFIEY
jgi:hypothetical protein